MEKTKVTPHPNMMINSKEDLFQIYDHAIEKDKYVLYSNKGTAFEKFLGSWDSEFEALKMGRAYPNIDVIHADIEVMYCEGLRVVCEVLPIEEIE
ncbi:hypothetical protein [Clostridium sp. 3-3]|uniref:hypothetical protein n=1 Tax=Clostridium TaxID=1485 RepID=UPI000CDB632D|nr:hypothetical protein [Clostridium sp. 3-3]POO87387.1 hypothetical protein C1H59_05885 [Clostridium sp. 3-3]